MDYRETTLTVFGATRTVRTERTGKRTVRQLETAHTRAVRAAAEELHAAGKAAALAAAKTAARAADAAAFRHHSGPAVVAAHEAHERVARFQKGRKFEAPAFPDMEARRRPHPPVKYDLAPTDDLFAGLYEFIDPDAPAAPDAAPAVEEPRAPMGAGNFLASLLAAVQPPAPAEEPDDLLNLEDFLNDFFAA